MNISRLVLLACFALSSAHAAPAASSQTIVGTWIDPCSTGSEPSRKETIVRFFQRLFHLPVPPKVHSMQVVLSFTERGYTQKILNYRDAHCKDLGLTYEVGGTYSLREGEIDYLERKANYNITLHEPETVAWANSTRLEGHTDWELNVAKHTRQQDSLTLHIYDLLEVEGDRLYRGEGHIGRTPASRPRFIGKQVYFSRMGF